MLCAKVCKKAPGLGQMTAKDELAKVLREARRLSCKIEFDPEVETVILHNGDEAYHLKDRWILTFSDGIVRYACSRGWVTRILRERANEIKGVVVSTEEV